MNIDMQAGLDEFEKNLLVAMSRWEDKYNELVTKYAELADEHADLSNKYVELILKHEKLLRTGHLK